MVVIVVVVVVVMVVVIVVVMVVVVMVVMVVVVVVVIHCGGDGGGGSDRGGGGGDGDDGGGVKVSMEWGCDRIGLMCLWTWHWTPIYMSLLWSSYGQMSYCAYYRILTGNFSDLVESSDH